MRTIHFTIDAAHEGMTVQHYLKRMHGMSTRVLTDLKKHPLGLLRNGEHIRTIDRLMAGDELEINLIEEAKAYLHSQAEVPILYEDEDVIVFNKPRQMPCHQSKYHQEDTLANVFAAHCAKKGEAPSFRCMGRLDKDTTGAVVVAKNAHAATRLWGGVDKVYTALLRGILPYEIGLIEAPIGRLGDEYINRAVTPDGQKAATAYQVRGYGEEYTLVDAKIYTGRTHQIRVHFSWLGYPLAGDDVYGWDHLLPSQALHCSAVLFNHPVTGEPLRITAPLPEDMQEAVRMAKVDIYANKQDIFANPIAFSLNPMYNEDNSPSSAQSHGG